MKRSIEAVTVSIALCASVGLFGCSSPSQNAGSSEQNEPAVTQVQQENEPSPLTVSESGYYFDSSGYAHFAAIIENPNKTWAAENISVAVAARDADGNVVDTLNDFVTLMFADGKAAICGDMAAPETTTELEFTASVQQSKWSKEATTQKDFFDQMPVVGLNESTDEWGYTTVAGEVENNTSGTFSGTRLQIVFRDANGSIVGGAYTYVMGDFTPEMSAPFSVNVKDVPEHASVEVYVDCGLPLDS